MIFSVLCTYRASPRSWAEARAGASLSTLARSCDLPWRMDVDLQLLQLMAMGPVATGYRYHHWVYYCSYFFNKNTSKGGNRNMLLRQINMMTLLLVHESRKRVIWDGLLLPQ